MGREACFLGGPLSRDILLGEDEPEPGFDPEMEDLFRGDKASMRSLDSDARFMSIDARWRRSISV
jgi:hypothetical protein